MLECCGHDGTYALKTETYEASRRIGGKAFDAMTGSGAQVWATECPLAAMQFEQHAGRKALHPMTILARAYRRDGSPDPSPPRPDMDPLQREDILDYVTYGEQRQAIRASAMAAKDVRRVHLGDRLTFLFENRETLRYQVLEMVRAEQMVRDSDIRHELETYNAVLGGPGELGCTLLIEIPDEAERAVLLRRWRRLPDHIFLVCADGTRVKAQFDQGQMSEEKLSSVQFIKFEVGRRTPAALVSDLPELEAEAKLEGATLRALLEDLA